MQSIPVSVLATNSFFLSFLTVQTEKQNKHKSLPICLSGPEASSLRNFQFRHLDFQQNLSRERVQIPIPSSSLGRKEREG